MVGWSIKYCRLRERRNINLLFVISKTGEKCFQRKISFAIEFLGMCGESFFNIYFWDWLGSLAAGRYPCGASHSLVLGCVWGSTLAQKYSHPQRAWQVKEKRKTFSILLHFMVHFSCILSKGSHIFILLLAPQIM